MDDSLLSYHSEVADTSEAATALAKRTRAGLEVYADQHPSLQGAVRLINDTIPPLQEVAGALSSLIPAARYLTTDPELTVLDHLALDSLLDAVVEQQDLLAAIMEAVTIIQRIRDQHDIASLGLSEED